MAQRLVRAKGKIREARIPYRVPDGHELPDRLPAVLSVVYLIFNEGYDAGSGTRLVREDLCAEAVRLGRLLAALLPDEPEVPGLLALMLLTESRHPARTGPDGELVPLPEQDRRLWDAERVTGGRRWSAAACGGADRGRTRSRRRSAPSTATRRTRRRRTGARSCCCTTSWRRSPRAPSWRSTGRSRWLGPRA